MVTVLIVDTDPVHRNLVTGFLTRAGYCVLETAHGIEAIQVLSGQEHVDVALIADANLMQTAVDIAAIRPSLPILLPSGEWSGPGFSMSLPITVSLMSVRKPLTTVVLVEELRRVLNRG